MMSFWKSRHPMMTVARIAVLAFGGWWLVKNFALAQLPVSIEWPNTDFANTSINLDEVMSGGPPKDGIPAIDEPKFVSVADAGKFVLGAEPVVTLSVGEDHRAYPLQILIWHEIVNDTVGGTPVSVTFCPLCNATLVFDRRINGKVLDFGTTGRLRKSDMVMYDRQTESWWQQFTGVGIVGAMNGVELKRVPASIVSFSDFATAHPDGKVLSRDTGHRRRYGQNPYQGYDNIENSPFLFFDPVDPRLPAMERILNITVGDTHKLYPFRAFAKEAVINDSVASIPVVAFSADGTLSVLDRGAIEESRKIRSVTAFGRRVNGRTLDFALVDGHLEDRQTNSRWNLLGTAIDGDLKGTQLPALDSGIHFAFAWLAFRPDTAIYGQ
ncbi:MAG: DUF3179 domain-containing protein [Pseudomonadota bacterium]